MLFGAAVSWRRKRKQVVAQSIVEAAYIALPFAVREVLWLEKIELGSKMAGTSINVGCDNQGALSIVSDDIGNERSHHIDAKYHFICDNFHKGTITLDYVPTSEMVADIMTENLPRVVHLKFLNMLGMKM